MKAMVKKTSMTDPLKRGGKGARRKTEAKNVRQLQLELLIDPGILSGLYALTISLATAQHVLDLMIAAIHTGDKPFELILESIRGMIHTELQRKKRGAHATLSMREIVDKAIRASARTKSRKPP